MSTWTDVEVGDTVRGKDGHGWAVDEIRNTDKGASRVATISRGARTFTVTVPRDSDVEILDKGAPSIKGVEETDLAAAVVTSTIGGEVILRDDDTGPFPRSPKTFQHPGSLLAHLWIEHGVRDLPTASKATAAHAEHHEAVLAGTRREGYRDHLHDL